MESTATSGYPGAVYDSRPQSPTITLGDWIVTYLITLVPLVGFIMLLVWAFSSSTPPSKSNWAKAALLVTVIVSILAFLFSGVIIAMLSGMKGSTPATTY